MHILGIQRATYLLAVFIYIISTILKPSLSSIDISAKIDSNVGQVKVGQSTPHKNVRLSLSASNQTRHDMKRASDIIESLQTHLFSTNIKD